MNTKFHSYFFVKIFLFALFLMSNIHVEAQIITFYNFSFERIDVGQKPIGWYFRNINKTDDYLLSIDSADKIDGKYSIKISNGSRKDGNMGACLYAIPAHFKGRKLTLTGFLKTSNIIDGYAGLILRVDGASKTLVLDNMFSEHLNGTNDWKKYSITVPYDEKNSQKILVGVFITAKTGKIWADNLHLYLDNTPINIAPQKKMLPADLDTSFSQASGINSIHLNADKLSILANLGMIWGFLKYYHPAITSGQYNWDAELFRVLHKIKNTTGSITAYKIIEQWVDGLGKIPACNRCYQQNNSRIQLNANYGNLFNSAKIPASLVQKLQFIRDNYKPMNEQYYVGYTAANVPNPIFKNEVVYDKSSYPDTGLRLLSLYRYWNMIQYFYPYRNLIDQDWNKIMEKFIPLFINAKNATEYYATCTKLFASIHDSHATNMGYYPILDSLKGKYIAPFQASFVENKLVVTGYYDSSIKSSLQIGDIIEEIDSIPIDSLVQYYLPYTPASNYPTQLRDLPSREGYLLRSGRIKMQLKTIHSGKEKIVTISRIPVDTVRALAAHRDASVAYCIMPGNIGYINPGKLKQTDLNKLKTEFANTKGIVMDFRVYPSISIAYDYSAWLKDTITKSAIFTKVNIAHPGEIIYGDTTYCGKYYRGTESKVHYKGQVIILVNSSTQSSGEFVVMALSTIPNAKVIGSTTAGADGNISIIKLPGRNLTWISGLGVYYPDGTPTQRTGVKIDIPVHQTVEGVKEGKDELLDKAIQLINRH